MHNNNLFVKIPTWKHFLWDIKSCSM